jgi:hypothetical protein
MIVKASFSDDSEKCLIGLKTHRLLFFLETVQLLVEQENGNAVKPATVLDMYYVDSSFHMIVKPLAGMSSYYQTVTS